ncbi:hypothetical protein [Ligilactobacillus murinus]|uniref:Uncharacterized protein n=1 Tax=Ligilactobacillus murinus TaxID=1622 RepID=A0AAD0P7L0_9LACO|nr:hypothetical protein [Ligilactobacillus murinus]AWZ37939.1 hypothetical protein CPS94_02875 [Ligilactobacillus murinus]AWZ41070.1 hypothetical protein CPQ89_08590 [Ligilactobacillus murinus]HCM79560.1 hypothetical protein [Lactobacillus sp.]
MTPDQIDEIETYNDPNSCYRSEPELLYTVTLPDGTQLTHQTQDDVMAYVQDELEFGILEDFKAVREEENE